MPRTDKSIEIESRLVVTRDWGEGGLGVNANGNRVPFWGDENVLELGSSDSCITL